MGVPYELPPQILTVADGETVGWLELDFPNRSFVSKVVVVQSGGTLGGTLAIFNSAKVHDAEIPADVAEENYLIGEPMTITSGKLLYFSDTETGGHGLTFYNVDEPDPGRIQSVGQRKLWVRLTLSAPASGAKKFAVSVGGEQQIE